MYLLGGCHHWEGYKVTCAKILIICQAQAFPRPPPPKKESKTIIGTMSWGGVYVVESSR